jgi:helix-turn-helix protein
LGAHSERMEPALARRMWQLLEPVHAVVYFAPEAREIYAAAGLKGGWMGYFASRAAAMGAVPPEMVIATFYNFHPNMVRRAIPDAWRFSTPENVLRARLDVADKALRRLLGPNVASDHVVAAAEIARQATESADLAGRPLFAAHASLAWPDAPHLVLWHAATLLREFRGDGHVATLLANGIDGCEAHVLITSDFVMPPEMQRENRGWSEEEWTAAEDRLLEHGLIDASGLTDAGRRLRAVIEDTTDRLALSPFAAVGARMCETLEAHLVEINRILTAGAAVPFPNPIGLTKAAGL